jgi:hypothetical protein
MYLKNYNIALLRHKNVLIVLFKISFFRKVTICDCCFEEKRQNNTIYGTIVKHSFKKVQYECINKNIKQTLT